MLPPVPATLWKAIAELEIPGIPRSQDPRKEEEDDHIERGGGHPQETGARGVNQETGRRGGDPEGERGGGGAGHQVTAGGGSCCGHKTS